MKKLIELSPLIAVALVIAILLCLFATGAFEKPTQTVITSSTLTEVIETAKLTTAQYIQHGVAKAHVEGAENGYILYYAIVKPNIDLTEIKFDIDHDAKVVTAVLPDKFVFDVELLEDEEHKFYYYPEDRADWTAKYVAYICETSAKQKAEANVELMTKARQSLENAITVLLQPILSSDGYALKVV